MSERTPKRAQREANQSGPKNQTTTCRKCRGIVVCADEVGVTPLAICVLCRDKGWGKAQ